MSFRFTALYLCFRLSQRRDAFASDNFPGKIKFLYHAVNKVASHAQLTFAALYDKDTTAK